MKEETLNGARGVSIFMRSWQPVGDPRAIVAMVPGFNAHSGYFKWVGEQFAANGLAAYAVDLRGRGKSEGERFYIDSISEYLSDVDLMVQTAKSRQPGLPVYLLGHSAGGVISCVYTLEHQDELAGLICESFAFRVPAPDIALTAFKGLSHLAPHAHLFKLKNEDFSRDPEAVHAMNTDPLIENETQPLQTIAEMVRADERIEREFPSSPCRSSSFTAQPITRRSSGVVSSSMTPPVRKTKQSGFTKDTITICSTISEKSWS